MKNQQVERLGLVVGCVLMIVCMFGMMLEDGELVVEQRVVVVCGGGSAVVGRKGGGFL